MVFSTQLTTSHVRKGVFAAMVISVVSILLWTIHVDEIEYKQQREYSKYIHQL